MSNVTAAAGAAGGIAGGASSAGGGWWTWGAAFAIYAVIMFAAGDSDQYGDAAAAVAWLVFLGAVAFWWNDLEQQLQALTGVNLSGGSVPAGARI